LPLCWRCCTTTLIYSPQPRSRCFHLRHRSSRRCQSNSCSRRRRRRRQKVHWNCRRVKHLCRWSLCRRSSGSRLDVSEAMRARCADTPTSFRRGHCLNLSSSHGLCRARSLTASACILLIQRDAPIASWILPVPSGSCWTPL
jgi:hypothetical protein